MSGRAGLDVPEAGNPRPEVPRAEAPEAEVPEAEVPRVEAPRVEAPEPEGADDSGAETLSARARDARSVDREAVRLARGRGAVDLGLGELLRRLFRVDGLIRLGFARKVDYARERLGVPGRTMYAWIRLATAVEGRPPLRHAVAGRLLPPRHAILVAPLAVGRDEAAWTTLAATRTLARRLLGRPIAPGEALATITDHFRRVWEEHDRLHGGHCGRRMHERREVLRRCGGLCAVPGCSRAAVHEHHIVFRSRGGTDDLWNRLGLCAVHHLRGIHRGWLTVSGRAGERLVWRFGAASGPAAAADAAVAGVAADDDADVESGSGSGSEFRTGARDGDAFGGAGPRCDPGPGPGQEWTTTGDDDVRQADRAVSSRRPQAREEVLMSG